MMTADVLAIGVGRALSLPACDVPFAEEAQAAEACLPGVLVQKNGVLIINVDLEFHIDVTSISTSATLGGNAYRAYAQMM